MIARLLALAVLLASLLVPAFAEASPSAGPATLVSAPMDQDGMPDAPSRPHGILHAGPHCACQPADRLMPPQTVGRPRLAITLDRPVPLADRARASHEAEPPSRPPRA